MSEENKQRLVNCVKIGKELPGLDSPPRKDELGQRIFESISAQAWALWQAQQTIIINHYGLNMVDPKAHEFLSQQMEEFFFGEGSQMPDDWIPEGEAPGPDGKGAPAPSAKDAPSSGGKGAPAPAQK
jgi:Fe-S cluster biosynthesis and repair protein YggX